MSPPTCHMAITRKNSSRVSHGISSLKTLQTDEESFINVSKAQQEHENYVNILKEHLETVIELEGDEKYPDCVFVEDPIVVVGNDVIFVCIND